MTVYNADLNRVAEAVENAIENRVERIEVWDVDAVMRGITREEMDDRNVPREPDSQVCVIELDTTPLDISESLGVETTRLSLIFHQNEMDEPITIDPDSSGSMFGDNQSTLPEEVSERLRRVQQQIDYAFDPAGWDLAEVNAASIAHGGFLTDYEFTYEAIV